MEAILADRLTVHGPVEITGPIVDLQGMTGFVCNLVIHSIAGTAPNMGVQLATSDDGKEWTSVGTRFSAGSASMNAEDVRISCGAHLQRFVRPIWTVTGTNSVLTFSNTLNNFGAT